MKSKIRLGRDESAQIPLTKVNTSTFESIDVAEELYKLRHMSPDLRRDVLERELDRIQIIFEKQFGREAARETFARRASALGESAPDPGMAAREVTKLAAEPKLSESELAEFRAHAVANPWDKRLTLPSEHIKTTFTRWLGRGLRKGHLWLIPNSTLAASYKMEIHRHPERRVGGLLEDSVRRLPAGSKRPASMRLMAELSETEQAEQRRKNIESQRRFRLKKAKKDTPAP